MLSRGTQREPTSAEREAQLRGSRELAAGLGLPRNNPVLKNEGQGLSKKQSADLQRAVEKAMLWCKDHGGAKYEDPDFPPSARAIYGDDPPDVFVEMPQVGEVAPKWKRPAEFAPEAPVLTKLEYQVENIRQGAVNDRWLISAINIVSSNTEQLMRAFLDPTKAADGGRVGPREKSEVHAFGQKYGFFACRLYHDDPLSDDDWAVVIVDDRVPLSALDGRPCFASHPDPSAYWGMILEKAAAKLAGSYAQLRGGTVVQGLKLLTGGRVPSPPRLTSEEGRALIPPSPTPNALWNLIMDKTATNHVVGAAHAAKDDAGALARDAAAAVEAAEKMGLVARRAYAVVACGEAMGFKLLKLRLPLAPAAEERARAAAGKPPEWIGRFSDESDDWRPQLRQMLSYSRNSADNTFWILYEDFCTHFNKVYFCRMADDVWTKYVVQSRWMDGSAGGSPSFLSWRSNYQWLMRVESRPIELVFTVTQADARKTGGHGRGYATAIGLTVARGNAGADSRRRKLVLPDTDVVATAGPKFAQQVQLTLRLEPSARPYVVVPCAHAPGIEGAFKLTVQADDANDDGVPDFGFAAVADADDWQCTVLQGAWAEGSTAAGGPPSAAAWLANPQFQLKVGAKARVFACVELVDVDVDGRDTASMQEGPQYPAIGLVAAAGSQEGAKLDGPPQVLREAAPRKADGAFVEFELPGATDGDESPPVVIVPYLQLASISHKFQLSVYTDAPHTLEPLEARPPRANERACEYCHAPAVIYDVLAKVDELERKTERLRALEAQFVAHKLECYGNRDYDCGPGWDTFNANKAQLDAALLQLGALGVALGNSAPLAPPKAPAPPAPAGPSMADVAFARALGSLAAEARARLASCPDIDADLGTMRIALRRMVSFGAGSANFASAADDDALLEQLARALGALNALLAEHGQPPLLVLIEGFSSNNAPCLLPCCARYQATTEGAPNCALARTRAFACKQRLVLKLVALDTTGRLRTPSAAAATILTAGYRFSRANALPGYDDGRNYPQNRRVEIRVLGPDEARAIRSAQEPEPTIDAPPAQPELAREFTPEPTPAASPAPRAGSKLAPLAPLATTPAPSVGATPSSASPTGATPAGTPPAGTNGMPATQLAKEEAKLAAALHAVEPEALAAIGDACGEVEVDLAKLRLRLRRPLAFVGGTGRFFDPEASDVALSQAAQVVSVLNRLLHKNGRPPLLVCVRASPPAEPAEPRVDLHRAEACALLFCARLAQVDGEEEMEVRARALPIAAPEVVPFARDALTGATPAAVELRFVGTRQFERLGAERARADAADEAEALRTRAADAEAKARAIAAEKSAAVESALAAERAKRDAEAERETSAAVAVAVTAERERLEAERRAAEAAKGNKKSAVCVVQ